LVTIIPFGRGRGPFNRYRLVDPLVREILTWARRSSATTPID